MEKLLQSVRITINDKLYLKDPESSNLGKRIVEESILMINDIGFESFTFKKLGQKIGSNESSIYRYFENKHKLLLYLASWYWGWLEYQLVFATNNIPDASTKLERAIESNMHLPPHTFVEVIMYVADAFTDGLSNFDDITLLAVSYNPNQS